MTGDLTARKWDLTWGEMYDDARANGVRHDAAVAEVEREMTEQFGDRPAEETT